MSRRRRRPRTAPWPRPAGPGVLPLTLPPLDPLETVSLVDLLEQLSDALWHAYGDRLDDVARRAGLAVLHRRRVPRARGPRRPSHRPPNA